MPKKISIRNLIIILLCLTIICMAIGFSILSYRLDTLKNKEEVFDVVIDKVVEETFVKGSKESPSGKNSITNKGNTVNMQFNLYAPQDELAYTLTIKNKGTIKAEIVDLISSPDYINDSNEKNKISPVTITLTDISGKVLEPGEETIVKVVVIYNQTSNPKKLTIPYQISLLTKSA